MMMMMMMICTRAGQLGTMTRHQDPRGAGAMSSSCHPDPDTDPLKTLTGVPEIIAQFLSLIADLGGRNDGPTMKPGREE